MLAEAPCQEILPPSLTDPESDPTLNASEVHTLGMFKGFHRVCTSIKSVVVPIPLTIINVISSKPPHQHNVCFQDASLVAFYNVFQTAKLLCRMYSKFPTYVAQQALLACLLVPFGLSENESKGVAGDHLDIELVIRCGHI